MHKKVYPVPRASHRYVTNPNKENSTVQNKKSTDEISLCCGGFKKHKIKRAESEANGRGFSSKPYVGATLMLVI